VDSGVEEGDAVTPYYDPMIAKLIAHADTRETAAQRLAAACAAVEVWPVKTNAGFLARIAADADFLAGRIDTDFIARHPTLIPADQPSASIMAQAARELLAKGAGPWEALHGFRSGSTTDLTVSVDIGGKAYTVGPRSGPATLWSQEGDSVLFADGQAWPFRAPRYEGNAAASARDGSIIAPMPGMVTVLAVKQGQAVKRGENLLVLEAMKMENSLAAPFDGVVAELHAALGAQVSEGTVLARIEKEKA
jgi:3-methylcrotonyl-CoA carboxylase alpha subunit